MPRYEAGPLQAKHWFAWAIAILSAIVVLYILLGVAFMPADPGLPPV